MDILRSIRDFHEHGARSIGYIDHQSQQQLQIPCFSMPSSICIFVKVYSLLFMPIHFCTGERVFRVKRDFFITVYYTIREVYGLHIFRMKIINKFLMFGFSIFHFSEYYASESPVF